MPSTHSRILPLAERESNESRARLEEAERIAGVGNWHWDIASGSLLWSNQVYRIFGLEPGAPQTSYEDFLSQVHEADRPRVEAAVERALADGQPYGLEHRIVLPDGSERTVEERGEVLLSEDGNPVGMRGTVLDITARKEIECRRVKAQRLYSTLSSATEAMARLKDEEELLRTVCQITVDDGGLVAVGVILRKTGDEMSSEMSAVAMAGPSADVAGGVTWLRRLSASDLDTSWDPTGLKVCNDSETERAFGDEVAEALRHMGGGSMAMFQLRRDGQVVGFFCVAAPRHDYFGPDELELLRRLADNLTFTLAALDQERQRQQTEKTLRQLSSAVEQTADHVIIADRRGVIEFVNPAFCDATGYSRDEAVGATPRMLSSGHHPPEFFDDLWRTVLSGDTFRAKFLNQRKDGSRFWEDKTITPIRDPRGLITHFVSVGRDITEQREAEIRQRDLQESLRRSETMAAMGRLVTGVAHEVRNPLFGLSATMDAFEAEFRGKAEMETYLQVFRTQISRMSTLMQDLLELGKPRSLNVSETIMAKLTMEAVEQCRPILAGHEFHYHQHLDGNARVQVDRGRFQQVLVNILENATQHTPKGGRIELLTTEQIGDDGQRWICIEVIDSGPGIPAGDLERIFEPFFSRRKHGTGLGLSIVDRIVQDHGGRIQVANRRPAAGAEQDAKAGALGVVVRVQIPAVSA